MTTGEGQLDAERVVQLLQVAEAGRLSARIWFETEIGAGEVEFCSGRIVGASMGPVHGRGALLRILSLSEGRYRIEKAEVPNGQALVPDVDWLIEEGARRHSEWRRLCEQGPALSSVLAITPDGRRALDSAQGTERLVLSLADGRRMLSDILLESNVDAVEALRAVVDAIRDRLLSETSQHWSLFPLGTTDPAQEDSAGGSREAPTSDRVPTLLGGHQPVEVAPQRLGTGTFGKSTLVGIGSLVPQEPILTASRIISIGDEKGKPGEPAPTGEAGAESEIDLGVAPDEGEPISAPADSLVAARAPEDSAAQALRPPQGEASSARYVGRYQVLLRIGRGGMGSVYLCRLTTEGGFRRLFALKLLRSHLSRNSAAAQAFLDEARLAGQLHHPNVVSVLDAGFHGAQPYLVMDYVEGCSLKRLLATSAEQATARLVVPIILDALEGLDATHNLHGEDDSPLEIVHCDVSPENLLVGVDGACRLVDFGVARSARGTGEPPLHGKPGFLAPEQILGQRVDRRADVFAMGTVLWTSLTGQRLFGGRTAEETLHQVCHKAIAPPSQAGFRSPPALDWICLKALERDPERRFQTATAMNEALRETAIREKLVAAPGDITAWVRHAVGRELTQRRLFILDSARVSVPAPPDPSGGSQDRPVPNSDGPLSTQGARGGKSEESRTVRLSYAPGAPRPMRRALLVAALLAAGAVVVALAWPGALSRIFSVDTGTVTSTPPAIDITTDRPASPGPVKTAPAGLAAQGPSAATPPTDASTRPRTTRGAPRPF